MSNPKPVGGPVSRRDSCQSSSLRVNYDSSVLLKDCYHLKRLRGRPYLRYCWSGNFNSIAAISAQLREQGISHLHRWSRGVVSIALLAPVTLSAQTVYQSTDEQGVVEFSDQPSSGSSEVTVNPNVVDIAPTPTSNTSQQPKNKQTAATPAPAPAEIEHTTVYTNNNNRARRHAVRERNDPGPAGPAAAPLPAPTPRAPTR